MCEVRGEIIWSVDSINEKKFYCSSSFHKKTSKMRSLVIFAILAPSALSWMVSVGNSAYLQRAEVSGSEKLKSLLGGRHRFPSPLVGPERRATQLNLFGKKKKGEGGEDSADDILNSPAFLKKKVEVLKKETEEAEQDIKVAEAELRAAEEEWGEQMTRLKNEYDFIKARSFNETRDAGDVATVKVIKEVLGVVDNFNRAFGAIKYETDEGKAVEDEFRTVYDDIEALFKELGVEEVETLGAEFDYECHEAITQMPSADYEEGIVCQEFQKGYKLKETLIRPAMVAVAM